MRLNTNTTILLTLLFSAGGSALAVPPVEDNACPNQDTNYAITEDQILEIAPKSTSCDGAEFKDECATADEAASAISASFKRYRVTSRAEQAAIIGLVAFESGEFKYNRSHFPKPGVEGKGTRNMQSPDFNAEYALSITEIKKKLCGAKGDVEKVLDILLENPEYDFGSGAWFLTTQCEDGVREQLQSGREEGWEAYITECVVTDANDERKVYWRRAVDALA